VGLVKLDSADYSPTPDPRPLSPDLRILLWDIDGTLVRTARVGVFKDYTTPALVRIFGTAGRLHELSVSGMTDLQIVCEALRDEGFTTEDVAARSKELCEHYVAEFERMAATNEPIYFALPGAREVLETLDADPRYFSALLTGNVEGAAYWKLRLVGLADFFRLPGAFGEDSHDRRDLPALAAARINDFLKLDLKPSQFVVIGDTPNDIACAKHFGARSVAVATGRSYAPRDLASCEPDALLDDLADTDAVLRTLNKL
jgi:phosphoglycolate phosphatase-like HAD superfamily hydrolase